VAGGCPLLTKWGIHALLDLESHRINNPDVLRWGGGLVGRTRHLIQKPSISFAFFPNIHDIDDRVKNHSHGELCSTLADSNQHLLDLVRRMMSANVQKLTDLLTERFNAWLCLNKPSNIGLDRIAGALQELSEIFQQTMVGRRRLNPGLKRYFNALIQSDSG